MIPERSMLYAYAIVPLTMAPGPSSWSTTLLLSSTSVDSRKVDSTDVLMQVTALHRYAVKGLSFDALNHVELKTSCFPDDRRFALLQQKGRSFIGEWLHKENFVCAFTHPELLAKFETSYRVDWKNGDDDHDGNTAPHRLLELKDRTTGALLLGPLHMETELGRAELAEFLSVQSGTPLVCVTSEHGDFQFGNTSSGVKNGDAIARSIHVVFQATVDALQEKIGIPLNPARFRPNIILKSDAPAWSEFGWIGKTLLSGDLQLKVVSKTVRCQGVGVDPFDPDHVLDIPELLMKHFPEHGPYLGVYCVLEAGGTLSVGDSLRLLN